ncbi:MAG TPA: arylsulfatase, partial [Prosthecobacter sp.]
LVFPHTYRSLGTQAAPLGGKPVKYEAVRISEAELYDLKADPQESKNLASTHPEKVAELQKYAAEMRAELGDELEKWPKGKGTREAGKPLAK